VNHVRNEGSASPGEEVDAMLLSLTLAGATLALTLAASWIFARWYCWPKRRLPPADPSGHSLAFENVGFSSQGVDLDGWYVNPAPAPSPRPAVVLVHGWSANALQMLPMLRHLRIPAWPVLPLVCRIIEGWLGSSMDEVAPEERIGEIRAPLLLIHGERDRFVPPGDMDALWSRADKDLAERWLVPGRRHGDVLADPGSGQRIVAFLRRHLEPPEDKTLAKSDVTVQVRPGLTEQPDRRDPGVGN
jgi:fermentation-respiration switch protein FrsA (DUF1100 family)